MKVIIDPGHGGKDPGGKGYLVEKDVALKISLYQHRRFSELKIPVELTRTEDITLVAAERTKTVRESGAKFCISNHINAGGGEGCEVIHSIHDSGQLAHAYYNALVAAGMPGRRVFTKASTRYPGKDWYYMLRNTRPVETCIIEYGFNDNKDDVERIEKHWKAYAEAVVKAFCEYNNVDYSMPQESELEAAVRVISEAGIIESPEYWIENAVKGEEVKGEYAGFLIQNMANKYQIIKKAVESAFNNL